MRTRLLAALSAASVLVPTAVLGGVVTPAGALPSSCATAGWTVTALHGPHFYVDTASTPVLRGAYAGYRVTNATGAPATNVWVQLTDFTGGSVALGPGQPAAQQIPSLADGASAARFSYLTASAATATAQNHTVRLWTGRPDLPGSVQVCTTTGGFSSVDETIKAAANKLTSVTVSAGTPKIGSTFSVTVQGQTGTIGSGTADDPSSFWMSPAASPSWPADAYRLVGTSLSFDGGAATVDTLRVSGLSSASKNYTAVYTFHAVGFTAAPTAVLPVQQIASGTQIKHTDTGTTTLPAITPSTNDLVVGQSTTPAKLPTTGGTVDVTVDLTGTAGAVLDSFTTTVPSGTTLVPGSAAWRGTPVPDAVDSSGALVFQGPFTVGSAPNRLTFTLQLPAVSGDRAIRSFGTVGAAQIDTTLSVTDDAPAGTSVNVNTVPVPVDDTARAVEGVQRTVAVLANDVDADGDPLTVTGAGPATHGTVVLDEGVVRYTADPGYSGPDSFPYTVSDGRDGTAGATVQVTAVLAEEADAGPAPEDDLATAWAGVDTRIEPLANDAGDELTITAVTTPAHGTATVTDDGSAVVYRADAEHAGADSFDYTVSDGLGATATATVDVTVTVPATLLAAPDAAPVAHEGSVTVDVLDNDGGQGALTLTAVTQGSAGGAASIAGGEVSYTAPDGFHGEDQVTYTLQDSLGRTTTGVLTLTVAPPALVGVDDTGTTGQAEAVTVDVLANDAGVGSLRIDGIGAVGHGTAEVTDDGRLRYTPQTSFTGTETITYTVADALDRTATATLTVTVEAAEALVAGDDVVTVPAGAVTALAVLDNDSGPGAVTLLDATDPAHGSVEVADGGITFTPDADRWGADSFTYRIEDGLGRTATATVSVTVTQKPAGVADTLAATWFGTTTLNVLANDPAGAQVAAVLSQPAHGTVTLTGGVVRFTRGAGSGPETFTYRVVGSAQPVTVTVTLTKPVATAVADAVTAPGPGRAVTVQVLANDTGHGRHLVAVTTPSHGSVSWTAAGAVTYAPDAGFKGADSFTYTFADVAGQHRKAAVTVTVPNAAPTMAAPKRVRLVAGDATTVPISTADVNGDPRTLSAADATGSAHAAADVVVTADGSTGVRVRAKVRFSGIARVVLTARDEDGAVARRTLVVEVRPAAARGRDAGLLPDAAATRRLHQPRMVDGRPTSRVLSARVDSRIRWHASDTSTVQKYRVTVGDRTVCTVRATDADRYACTLRGTALTEQDRVRVTAVGARGTESAVAAVPVRPSSDARHLLAVVYFSTSDYALDGAASDVLAKVAAQAREAGFSRTLIVGHTDADGSAEANRVLSRQRAATVARYLTTHHDGIAAETSGRGEADPLMSNATSRGKAVNRRVEVYIG